MKIVFRVMCDYEDGSCEMLEQFDTYGDAEKFIIETFYNGDLWIKKVWTK
jgi:hypothetical protein